MFLLTLSLVLSQSKYLIAPLSIKDTTYWCKTNIDYSAANEYFRAHYQPNTNYFHHHNSSDDNGNVSKNDVHLEKIHNARQGYWDDTKQTFTEPSLTKCGFTLCQSHAMPMPQRIDFSDINDIKFTYIPHLKKLIDEKLFHDKDGTVIKHLHFWHPMLRSEVIESNIDSDDHTSNGSKISIKKSSIAPLVHIDSDINAFTLDELLSIVENNLIQEDDILFDKENIIKDIQENNHRFLLLNIWRNIDKTNPIKSAPLALFVPKYDTLNGYFPLDKPNMSNSYWYTYPNMTYDECLFFLQYDRKASIPSDIWHCALSNMKHKDVMRKSFDVKVFIVLNETFDDSFYKDRWRDKVPSILSLKESECFCESQAKNRSL